MTGSDIHDPQSAAERYWTVLPKYIAAVNHAITVSQKIANLPVDSPRKHWASLLFTRLCAAAVSILHLCPGSPANKEGVYWDFGSVAPLVKSLVRTGLMLFYLGTEVVEQDESHARLLIMQLRERTERRCLFENLGASEDKIRCFELEANQIRSELLSNSYFAHLPPGMRKKLLKGDSECIHSHDQILDRLGILDQAERALLGFIFSNADVSPLTYCLTGINNRGRGEENDVDKSYITTAVDIACGFMLRADADVQALFRETLAANSHESRTDKSSEGRVKHAIDYVLQAQGGHIQELAGDDDMDTPILCSHCFHDEGLRLSSSQIGQRDMSKCPNCGSQVGIKLSRRSVVVLAKQFFVGGTIQRLKYGGFPAVQMNKHQPTSIQVASWLEPDLRLIEKNLQAGFFHYGPRMWMVGEVEPLKALQKTGSRSEVILRILNEYPGRILNIDECFYRMRKAPTHPGNFEQYDSPPDEKLGEGRFDTAELPILYGSQDLEVCLHECRVAADDEVYIATLVPVRPLRLLNVAEALWEENVTEFESLDMSLHMLFLAGRHSYEISREIATAAYNCGFDGLVYPSYFTLLRTGETPFDTTYGISQRRFPGFSEYARKNTISNLALFGKPIADGSVIVQCINKVILNKVDYKLHFGPLLVHGASSDATLPQKRNSDLNL